MWTDEARNAELIFAAVQDPVAQRLLYQGQMHVENFRQSSKQLQEAFQTLLFHDFARTQNCHMTEGIFGADIHASEMESAKVRVWGFLLNTCTAGHRLLRCCVNARRRDRGPEWACLRDELKTLPEIYRRTRNFLEHLDEATQRQDVADIEDCKFSRHGILIFKDDAGQADFDFTEEGLAPVEKIWNKLLAMLKARRVNRGVGKPAVIPEQDDFS